MWQWVVRHVDLSSDQSQLPHGPLFFLCVCVALTLEPLRHLAGNWEREVRWMDWNRAAMLSEPGKVEKC